MYYKKGRLHLPDSGFCSRPGMFRPMQKNVRADAFAFFGICVCRGLFAPTFSFNISVTVRLLLSFSGYNFHCCFLAQLLLLPGGFNYCFPAGFIAAFRIQLLLLLLRDQFVEAIDLERGLAGIQLFDDMLFFFKFSHRFFHHGVLFCRGNDDYTIAITEDDVAGLYRDAAAADRNIQLRKAFLDGS